ncbi:hypothetical protein [Streptomyces hawaiiensis]|uniref:hypothetical protein n=1 Tax=Streptomyces hawaiiensis TaxID=67305 RepID=UPI003668E97E
MGLTVERAAAFRAAAGSFVPGAVDPGTVKELVGGVDGPLNVMAGPGAPPVAEPAAWPSPASARASPRPPPPWSAGPPGSCRTGGPAGR